MTDIQQHLGRDISLLYRYNCMFMDQKFAAAGLKHGQIIFLAQLYTQHKRSGPPLTQEALTALLQFDKATTAKAMKTLEAGGWITRRADTTDKRCKRIQLTAQALDFAPTFFSVLEAFEQQATQGLSAGEVALLRQLLKIMSGNMTLE